MVNLTTILEIEDIDIDSVYVLVPWPDVQELMDKDWFKDEAILDVDAKFGSSEYFIPMKRLIDFKTI